MGWRVRRKRHGPGVTSRREGSARRLWASVRLPAHHPRALQGTLKSV